MLVGSSALLGVGTAVRREPSMSELDKTFAGSIPKLYEAFLVPLLFEPYAADLARRVSAINPSRILEVAAGTGVVTRHLAVGSGTGSAIVATDLNQAMLDEAAAIGTSRPVQWRQADAMALPFGDAEFDVVVCQFGAMFFPDKPRAFSEARRVLKPGGSFIFNVWDRISENEFGDSVAAALAAIFPEDPPRFLSRMPYGYHDQSTIAQDLAAGGFNNPPQITTVAARSRAASPRVPALAFCQGSPQRYEIEARDATRLGEVTDAVAAAVEKKFGRHAVEGKIQALVVVVVK